MHIYGAAILDHLHPITLFVYPLFELSVNENFTYIFRTISVLHYIGDYIRTVSKANERSFFFSFPCLLF